MPGPKAVLASCWYSWFWIWATRMAFTVLVPAVAAEYSLSAVEAGLLAGAYQASVAVGMIAWAPLADLAGPKRVASMLLAFSGLLTAAMAASPSFMVLAVIAVASGLLLGGWQPNCVPIVGGLYESRRGSALGAYDTGAPLGFAAGASLAGLLYGALGWRGVVALMGLAALLPAIAVYALAPSARAPAGERGRTGRESHVFSLLLLLCFVAVASSVIGLPAYLPVYLTSFAGAGVASAALAVGPPRASGPIGQLLGGWASDKVGRGRVLVALLLVVLAGDTMIAVSGGFPLLLEAGLVAEFMAGAAFFPVAFAVIYERYPGYRGSATGFFLFAGNAFGAGAVPPLLAWLDASTYPGAGLWLVPGIALAGLFASAAVMKMSR